MSQSSISSEDISHTQYLDIHNRDPVVIDGIVSILY